VRYGSTDASAAAGHHNDLAFHDPIWERHAFSPLRVSTASPSGHPRTTSYGASVPDPEVCIVVRRARLRLLNRRTLAGA
jgi:hypothetical protein